MSEIISHKNPKSIIAESVKILRTNLQFSNVDGTLKTVMVTSSVPGEGKSFTSSNLAVAFAQLGMKVLVVDCDMRRGIQHKQFTVTNTNGLSDLLIDSAADYVKYIKPTGIENLSIVTAGTVPPNPSELLSSKSFETFVGAMREVFDMVIFDLPPVTVVPDAAIVATRVDKTVIVTRVKVTPMEELEKTKKMLENVGANIAGVVVNGVKTSGKKYYGKYYN
ncbi:MAG: CpsD/CapB family tyrosine-protein kinase [Clostridia bacterium]|nr:CpsD/CapB family tyrosine-protein kinase [Clostridia bacterium]